MSYLLPSSATPGERPAGPPPRHPPSPPAHLAVAIDGSDEALIALDLALALCARRPARLDLLAVVPTEASFRRHAELAGPLLEALREDAGGHLEAAAARAAQRGPTVRVLPHLREGHPAQEILRHLEPSGAEMLLLGSRGLSARDLHLLGSTSYDVAHLSKRPVVIARHGEAPKRPLVGLDGSAASRAAAAWAARLVAPAGGDVTLLYVIPQGPEEVKYTVTRGVGEPFLLPVARELEAQGTVVRRQVEYGHPAETLLRVAKKGGHDLIALGRVGRAGPAGFALGGVPDKLLHHATTSLLLVP